METVIEVSHLKRYFKEVKAVDDISFSVEKGELFGFLGVNGAGKSTTINMLCTLLPPSAGEVTICKEKLGKNDEAIKTHIGVVYQHNCLDNRLTVRENLVTRGRLYEKERKKWKKNLQDVSEILSLSDVMERFYGKLSGGQKRRAEIAAALMHTPDILFLDEPTTGLDPATRKDVWQAISALQKELKMTVFLTTHYMEEAAKATHIAIMDKGHLIQFGTPFSLKEEFARDKLHIIPKEGEEEKLQAYLKEEKIICKRKEQIITIPIDCTLDAISHLEKIKEWIQGFEVIQGTMDDVFLNATKEENA